MLGTEQKSQTRRPPSAVRFYPHSYNLSCVEHTAPMTDDDAISSWTIQTCLRKNIGVGVDIFYSSIPYISVWYIGTSKRE